MALTPEQRLHILNDQISTFLSSLPSELAQYYAQQLINTTDRLLSNMQLPDYADDLIETMNTLIETKKERSRRPLVAYPGIWDIIRTNHLNWTSKDELLAIGYSHLGSVNTKLDDLDADLRALGYKIITKRTSWIKIVPLDYLDDSDES